jgi:hypothetical protein
MAQGGARANGHTNAMTEEKMQVKALFTDEHACVRGIERLREAGFSRPHAFSPFMCEDILAALQERRSPVRFWVLTGGITGCTTGFALTIGLMLEYPHVTAGMPIVSIPPFVIIAFELTILFGALFGVIGFLLHGRFPRVTPVPGYDVGFTNDRFGVVVQCEARDQSRAESLLRDAGASEVTSEVASEVANEPA